MMSVNKMFVMLSQATASANRIADVMNLPEERPAGASIESPIKEGVVFDDVCFSYAQPANGYTLEHISFHLKKGQVLGVIGATGSGKTTLIQLLQRFYPVDSGAIYIEGKNINAMEEEKLHSLFGVAFQSDSFFIRDDLMITLILGGDFLRKTFCVLHAAPRQSPLFWIRRRDIVIQFMQRQQIYPADKSSGY